MHKKILFSCLIFLVIFSSCSSYKKIPYYQDLDYSSQSREPVENYSALHIQPADLLAINVNSRNPESSSIFRNSLQVGSNPLEAPISGYLVDTLGQIDLPIIGTLTVSGLTTNQLKVKLKQMMLTYYKDPVVSVRILNFKVTVYGDVQRPDVYTLQNERTTITQALTLAGDLNITAKRTNIILIREEDGKRNYIPIDLTSKKLFNSPYYYLKNNDEIYVQPDRTKYASVDRGYRSASLILSGLSIIAIVISTIYR